MELINGESLRFTAQELREIYEPIVSKHGFEYEACLDRHKTGLVWSKLYEGDRGLDYLWPSMVIRERHWDTCPSDIDATYFSTSLYWSEPIESDCFTLEVNPKEFDVDYEDESELEVFCRIAREAQEEANYILEECRKELIEKLAEIREKLIQESSSKEEELI
jgi:hypothetical protein